MKRGEAGKLVSRCDYLTAADKSVFRTLLERANNYDCTLDAKYTPTVPQLILATSLARATVFRALGHLETHRWLVRTPGKGRTHKSGYALVVEQPHVACECQKVSSGRPKRSQGETERVSLVTELSQVKPRFDTRTAEEEREGHCQVFSEDGCDGSGSLLSCQLCPKSPTYWRTAS